MEKPQKFVLLTNNPSMPTSMDSTTIEAAIEKAKAVVAQRATSIYPIDRAKANFPIYVMGVVAVVQPDVPTPPPVVVHRFDQ